MLLTLTACEHCPTACEIKAEQQKDLAEGLQEIVCQKWEDEQQPRLPISDTSCAKFCTGDDYLDIDEELMLEEEEEEEVIIEEDEDEEDE